MRYLLIAAAAAGALYFWKSRQEKVPAPEPVQQADKTPGANMENRVNNLSGAAPID